MHFADIECSWLQSSGIRFLNIFSLTVLISVASFATYQMHDSCPSFVSSLCHMQTSWMPFRFLQLFSSTLAGLSLTMMMDVPLHDVACLECNDNPLDGVKARLASNSGDMVMDSAHTYSNSGDENNLEGVAVEDDVLLLAASSTYPSYSWLVCRVLEWFSTHCTSHRPLFRNFALTSNSNLMAVIHFRLPFNRRINFWPLNTSKV